MVRNSGFINFFPVILAVLLIAGCVLTPKESVYIYVPDPLDYASTNGDNWVNPTAYTTLVWSDEFSATNMNTANWVFDLGQGSGGWGNSEWETYTSGNYVFTNGNLVIKAFRVFNGYGGYTSTRITTLGKQHFKYGTIAARIKMPYGQGVWPAFWMMGTNGQTWPQCGEIDIAEMIGKSNQNIYGNIFWYDGGQQDSPGVTTTTNATDLKDEFHVFAVQWTKTNIKWYFDHSNYMTRTITGANQDELTNQHYYILLNLAIGGTWPGYPTGSETYPQRMFIDWVRVYQ